MFGRLQSPQIECERTTYRQQDRDLQEAILQIQFNFEPVMAREMAYIIEDKRMATLTQLLCTQGRLEIF
jgi:hypothetical protein